MAILDSETDSALMVMELDAYEQMLEKPIHAEAPQMQIEKLTEEELMEKINKDVAVWRAYNDKERQEKIDEEEVLEKKVPVRPMPVPPTEAEIRPTVAKNFPISREPAFPREDREISPEDSAADIASEEDEDTFLLEPVE